MVLTRFQSMVAKSNVVAVSATAEESDLSDYNEKKTAKDGKNEMKQIRQCLKMRPGFGGARNYHLVKGEVIDTKLDIGGSTKHIRSMAEEIQQAAMDRKIISAYEENWFIGNEKPAPHIKEGINTNNISKDTTISHTHDYYGVTGKKENGCEVAWYGYAKNVKEAVRNAKKLGIAGKAIVSRYAKEAVNG